MKKHEDAEKITAMFAVAQAGTDTFELTYLFYSKTGKHDGVTLTVTTEDEWGVVITGDGAPMVERVDERTTRLKKHLRQDVAKVTVRAGWGGAPDRHIDVLSFTQQVPLNTASPQQVVVATQSAPRLSTALNEAPVRDPKERPDYPPMLDFSDPGPLEVRYLLRYVFERLEEGLIKAWRQAFVSAALDPKDDAAAGDEERWARQVSEMQVGAAYLGPGQTYYGSGKGDVLLFDHLQDPGVDAPYYPITLACQHLCSMALIARGLRFKKLGVGQYIEAAENSGQFGAFGGTWLAKGLELKDVPTALQKGLVPGSVYAFSDKPKKQAGAHVAYVLRTQPESGRLQFLDTGGMNSPNVDAPGVHPELLGPNCTPTIVSPRELPPAAESKLKQRTRIVGTYDFPATDKVNGTTATFAGLGLPPAAKDIASGVERMRRARPLGFVRLLIVRRKLRRDEQLVDFDPLDEAWHEANATLPPASEWLVWASPLLPMHHGDSRYSTTRLLWALRNVPGNEHLRVIWTVDLPQKARLTHALLTAPEASLRAAFESVHEPIPHPFGETKFPIKLDELVKAEQRIDAALERELKKLKPTDPAREEKEREKRAKAARQKRELRLPVGWALALMDLSCRFQERGVFKGADGTAFILRTTKTPYTRIWTKKPDEDGKGGIEGDGSAKLELPAPRFPAFDRLPWRCATVGRLRDGATEVPDVPDYFKDWDRR